MSRLAPYFLGAHGENDALFEQLLVDALHEHVDWRRSFHPEDLPPLDAGTLASSDSQEFAGHLRHELARLTAALRRSVPFSSPRYIGHMASDLLLPGLLAQLVTTLYNPNNVTSEAAPVTVELEREAIAQLAGMLGYDARAWGHLAAGGTIANIEGLWHARAVRCFPLALARALSDWPGLHAQVFEELAGADDWQLMNLPVDTVMALYKHWAGLLDAQPAADRRFLAEQVRQARVEHQGMAAFLAASSGIRPPVVLVPKTAHYSWKKAMELMGFGSGQLRAVPVTSHMRMDPEALAQVIRQCAARREPVLAVVAVLGTTEYGTIDPLHDIVALRERCTREGYTYYIHADAAWGGYIASMLRAPGGGLRSCESVRADFRYFPSSEVYDAFAALPQADFATVDPHKLGYLPFGVGAFISRNGQTRHLVAQQADYVFGDGKHEQTGRYTLEGSRPGAPAAAVCMTHRVLPLHAQAFGRLPLRSIQATEYLYDRLHALAGELGHLAHVCVPFEPDTNLICVAVNPAGNAGITRMNEFMQRLYGQLSVDDGQALQSREFFGSQTTVALATLAPDARQLLLDGLGLAQDDPADKLVLLRHTLMNPWLFAGGEGGNYLDRYVQHLRALIEDLLGEDRVRVQM